MAIGDPYATLDDLKTYMSLEAESMYDTVLGAALESVSREIESFCNRQFNQDASATVREFDADTRCWAEVDDFWTVTGLVVESGHGYGTVWASADYRLDPRNGIVEGQPGWPFGKVTAAVGGRYRFDQYGLRVTAKWGWTAVPAPVRQACLIMAAETFQIKNAPFGVAGLDQFGAIRVRDNRMAATKLSRYVRNRILVG